MFKSIFKITSFKVVSFIVIYGVLWFLHIWCMPIIAIPISIKNCGIFSNWILENDVVFNIWRNLSYWHILIIVFIIIILASFIKESIKSKNKI